jgi:Flp pilus assembly protein protease CpaA
MTSPEVLFPLVGLLLIGLGGPLAARRVRPNRWYGLRVPATFADQTVWYEANAVAGRDMVRLGSLVTAIALVLPHVTELPSDIYAGVCGGVLGIGSFILAARGWRLANRMLRERRAGTGA